jgi:anti-sigma-K factor RskA
MRPDLHGLAGPYALDALDDNERAVFEEHLASCPDCADEVGSLRSAAAELSHVTATAPPPALRADVLSSISRQRPLPPLTDNVIALRRPRAGRSAWQVLAAACAIVAIIAGVWGYQQHRLADRRATTAQQSQLVQLLSAPDVRAVTGRVGGGQATLVYSKSEGKAVLVGQGIPAPPPGKAYQLWMISEQNGTPTFTSAGTFAPDSSGQVRTYASGDLANTSQMGVTVEPAGGSNQPTSAPIATIKL